MSEPLHGVVVCHGELAQALVNSTEQITGVRGALTAVSNTGCDRGTLEERIVAAVGTRPAVVFVDMASGSCLFAAMRRLSGAPGARLVTGVNLAMLIDFVFHRDGTPDAGVARAARAGAQSISVP